MKTIISLSVDVEDMIELEKRNINRSDLVRNLLKSYLQALPMEKAETLGQKELEIERLKAVVMTLEKQRDQQKDKEAGKVIEI